MPLVREELGPSLPQLMEPRWTALSRPRRIALVAGAVLLLALLVAAWQVLRSDPLEELVVDDPIAFNFVHRADLDRVDPGPGELLRMQAAPGSRTVERFVVRLLTVPPFRGDISSSYLGLASERLAQLRGADPNVIPRGEGKARINLIPGYQLSYQTRMGGKLVFGKRFFLVPEAEDGEPQTRDGVELELLSEFSPSTTANLADVGNTYLLKAPLRSFRFGTERP